MLASFLLRLSWRLGAERVLEHSAIRTLPLRMRSSQRPSFVARSCMVMPPGSWNFATPTSRLGAGRISNFLDFAINWLNWWPHSRTPYRASHPLCQMGLRQKHRPSHMRLASFSRPWRAVGHSVQLFTRLPPYTWDVSMIAACRFGRTSTMPGRLPSGLEETCVWLGALPRNLCGSTSPTARSL